MEKLTLEHLAPYLPYSLKLTKEDWGKTFKMDCDGTTLNCIGIDYILHTQAKPILRRLSYLTKEIEVNGEKFIPCIEYGYIREFLEELSTLDYSYIKHVQYKVVVVLLELHFDVSGLIPKGLAIDINTI